MKKWVISFVSDEMLGEIIEAWEQGKKFTPGLFVTYSGVFGYTACWSDGFECWVEDFKTLEDAVNWLMGEC